MADNGSRRRTPSRASQDGDPTGREVVRFVPRRIDAGHGRMGRPAGRPSWPTSGAPRHNLPAALTRFVGRERELAVVERLLASTCLLTLTGAGGIGKTRLALEVAADLLDAHRDGVWLVELAPLADPALVPEAVATVLGVREQPGRPLLETLVNALRPKQLLLVLDNCEHLVGACATLVDTLLQACPDLRVLATSRQPLGIAGETDWRVPPLAAPELARAARSLGIEALREYEAVRLFVDRAQAARPAFALTDRNAAAVARVCSQLDGIPLAIELAAVRVKALTPEQIAQRLDDRFRLLTSGSRTAMPRHQTLRALVDWSYELLSESERLLLCRLSVFAGGWTLEGAEAVCADTDERRPTKDEGRPFPPSSSILRPSSTAPCIEPDDVVELLAQLVDKSLVLAEQAQDDGGDEDGETRYRLLETIRQYAAEHLDGAEAAALRRRHRDWFLQVAERAEAQVWGREQVAGLDRLDREHDDLRVALRWSAEQGGAEAEPGLRLAGALWRFWQVRGHLREGRGWLARLLALAPAAPTAGRAKALNALAFLAFMEGDYAAAQDRHRETLAIRRALGDREGIAESLNNLGLVLRCLGDHATAGALFEEALAASRALGDRSREVHVLNNLARSAYYQGDYASACTLHEQSLAVGREVGDTWGIAICLGDLGDLHQAQGDEGAARALYGESLALWRELGDHRGVAQCLEGFAGLAARSQPARAVRLIGAAAAARELIGEPCSPGRQAVLDRTLDLARQALGEDGYAAAWAEGRALPLDRAVEYASGPEAEPPAELRAASSARAVPISGVDEPAGDEEADGNPLTRREREVARLVARGRTNRQIAEELVIGERTAESHVASILGKLGAAHRAQVAAWAVERGLV